MIEELTVTGGAGGIAAEVADMRATAAVLDARGDVARRLAQQVSAVATHPAVLASQVYSPVTGAGVLADVARTQLPPDGLTWIALEFESAAAFLRGAATAYEATDAALAALAEARDTTAGVLVLGGGLLTAGGIWLTGQLHDAQPGWFALAPDAFTDWLEEVGQAPGGTALGALYDHPWITDSVISALPGLLSAPFTGFSPWPTLTPTYEQVVAGVISAGNLLGYFGTGEAVVKPEPRDARYPDDASWQAALDATAADSVAGLFDNIAELGDGPNSEVRVTAVADDSGGYSWIVEIPGTQSWSAVPGSNPADLSSNLHLMAGTSQTALEQGVLEAVDQAMTSLSEETGIPLAELKAGAVTLAGHSQGGIVAAALAADPTTDLNITNVVTGGSPVANMELPDHVSVLSIEHQQDPVHHLDGNPNPSAANWTTVVRDVDGHSAVTPGDPFSAHHGGLYADTGALIDEQAGTDPVLTHALADLQEQFADVGAGGATVFQYDISQEPR